MTKKTSVDLESDPRYVDENMSKVHLFRQSLNYLFAFKLIKKYTKSRKISSVLELGTGSGYFLLNCKKKFPYSDLYGVEYDPRLLAITKRKVPDCNLIEANVEEFNFTRTFDVIVSFQVIEHLYHPELMLKQVKKHLNKDGVFIVSSPNLDGLGAKIMKSKWGGYRHDHVSLKGADDWKSLIESHGFESQYSGTTFFSGIPIFRKLPFGLINWSLLLIFGALRWSKGEAYIGAFILKSC